MDHRQARASLGVVFVAAILSGIDATMLSVALPAVVRDPGATILRSLPQPSVERDAHIVRQASCGIVLSTLHSV